MNDSSIKFCEERVEALGGEGCALRYEQTKRMLTDDHKVEIEDGVFMQSKLADKWNTYKVQIVAQSTALGTDAKKREASHRAINNRCDRRQSLSQGRSEAVGRHWTPRVEYRIGIQIN